MSSVENSPDDFDFIKSTSVFQELFNRNVHDISDNTVLYTWKEKTVTYSELLDLILIRDFNLQENFKLQKCDVLAVRSTFNIEYPILLHSTVCAGGSIVLVKYSPEDEIEVIAEDLKTVKFKIFVTEKEESELSLETAAIVGIPKSNILIIEEEKVNGFPHVNDLLLSKGHFCTPYVYSQEFENFPAYPLYTSGFTGKKKGCHDISKGSLLCYATFP